MGRFDGDSVRMSWAVQARPTNADGFCAAVADRACHSAADSASASSGVCPQAAWQAIRDVQAKLRNLAAQPWGANADELKKRLVIDTVLWNKTLAKFGTME